jgi:hypothetical protein
MVDWYSKACRTIPCIALADRLYLIYLEAGLRRFPPWMLGTL